MHRVRGRGGRDGERGGDRGGHRRRHADGRHRAARLGRVRGGGPRGRRGRPSPSTTSRSSSRRWGSSRATPTAPGCRTCRWWASPRGRATASSFRGGGETRTLEPGADYVAATKHVVDAVSVSDAEFVFVGYGARAPEYDWDDFGDTDVSGKILLFLVNDPPLDDAFGGPAMTYYGRWTYKHEIAAELGAAGSFVIHETGPAGYPWEVVGSAPYAESFDLIADDDNLSRATVEGWVQRATAEMLFELAGLDFEAAKQQAADRAFQPIALGGDGLHRDPERAAHHRLAERAGAHSGHRGPRRGGDVRRPLGPHGHGREPRRRPDLQRRRRQRHRHPGARRDRPRLHGRGAAAAVHRVPRRHRRGAGAAGVPLLRRAAAVSDRPDRRRHQHGRAEPVGAHARHDHRGDGAVRARRRRGRGRGPSSAGC